MKLSFPKKPLLATGAVLASLALALSGCSGSTTTEQEGGSAAPAGDGKLQALKDKGSITVSIAGEAPYSYEEGGKATGATIALAEKIFGDMGIKEVKTVLVDWNGLIPGLTAGRADAVSAGMSILPDRCANADFANPEIMYTTALMTQKGNPKSLSDLDSVKKKIDDGEKIKLAVLAGGIEAGYAKSLGLKVQSVPDAQTGMDTVDNGRADAFAMTAISLNFMAEQNKDANIEVTDAFVQDIDGKPQIGAGATVFAQGDDELRDAYNEGLAKITESEESYLDVVGEYGFTAENLPPKDLTTEELCKG
ncbi:ectoine/hydroxyectoine ABC transporter substrate-binding protein EhuB [Paeniglutamicibacter antarcticus]|uniref:Transporter substrate-binding domain-containing protein n=1 Tax=Paeniglutamicibacter antarcticus TaxID=494023 RepID=A0ABP9TT50_9MICC